MVDRTAATFTPQPASTIACAVTQAPTGSPLRKRKLDSLLPAEQGLDHQRQLRESKAFTLMQHDVLLRLPLSTEY
jgi:hypothetical protein